MKLLPEQIKGAMAIIEGLIRHLESPTRIPLASFFKGDQSSAVAGIELAIWAAYGDTEFRKTLRHTVATRSYCVLLDRISNELWSNADAQMLLLGAYSYFAEQLDMPYEHVPCDESPKHSVREDEVSVPLATVREWKKHIQSVIDARNLSRTEADPLYQVVTELNQYTE